MTNSSNSPVALVTGSRTGVGRAVAEFLLTRGYHVIGCSRKPSEWEASDYTHVQCDVTNEADVKALFHEISQRYGRLDVAINNAGVASMNHMLLTPVSTVRHIVDTHICGTFSICREAVMLMRKRKYGRIVNFGSAAVPLRYAGEAAYVASKHAVVSLSQVIAKEIAEFGITINVVGPAPTPTDMIRGVPKAKIDKMLELFPIKRLTTFADICNVIEFFLRPESDAVTGQVIYLGGVPNQ